MAEVIIFAGLLGIIAGAMHLYHKYVTEPYYARELARIDALRRLVSDCRITAAALRTRVAALETALETEPIQRANYSREALEYGGLANDDDDDENDDIADPLGGADVWEEVDRLKQNAERKFSPSMVGSDPEVYAGGIRSLLPSSAVAAGFAGLSEPERLSPALGRHHNRLAQPGEEEPV